jgi:hypothetical protein
MRKFPLTRKDSEEEGAIKMDTLEYFVGFPGWHGPAELKDNPVLADSLLLKGSRAIQMRLLRYSKQGLLSRRRAPRGYEYMITMKGEDRLFYLWNKFGITDACRKLTSEESESMRELLNLKLAILKSRKNAL